MTLLERPSNCELELGLLTQCVPISFTGPHQTLVWQGWCCDSEYGPAGSRHVYWDHLDVHFLEWPGVGYQGSQVQGACAPVKIKRQGWSALCQGTAYPDIAEPQWCHIPPMQALQLFCPSQTHNGDNNSNLPQLTSCVGVMETHTENGLQSGAQTQEFPRKTPLFSSLETPWRIFGQLWAVLFVAGKSSREDRHPKGLKAGWFWRQMSQKKKKIGQCSYLCT